MNDHAPVHVPRYDLVGATHDYPAWTGRPTRTLLICSHQRSGSTMLGEALYFAGGLGCPLEYFHAGFRPGFEARWNISGLHALTRKVWRHRTDPNGVMSAKLFWNDIADIAEQWAPGDFPSLRTIPSHELSPETYRALNALLCELFPDPVHVHLERRDRLRQAVSWFTAIRTNSWRHIPTVEENVAADKVDYDFDRIGQLVAASLFSHAHWRAFFAANGIVPYDIDYEELIGDYTRTIERLLRTLGNPAAAPAVRMERQSTVRNEELLRRFLRDQVAARRT